MLHCENDYQFDCYNAILDRFMYHSNITILNPNTKPNPIKTNVKHNIINHILNSILLTQY